MIDLSLLDQRPIVVAIAGPNGAGKSTFYDSHLASAGLRFVNADVLGTEISLEPYAAARLADSLRKALVEQRESFVFETVFSDPMGDKLRFLEETAQRGYTVVLCYIGLASPEQSLERVAMRVLQGGHGVPREKLLARFSRTLDNLRSAIQRLPHVAIYDNSDLSQPYRPVAVFENAQPHFLQEPLPEWLQPLIP
jgi:predicted ABC-type ATPase